MKTSRVYIGRKRDEDGDYIIMVQYSNGETEEVDTAETRQEAKRLVSEYRMAFNC